MIVYKATNMINGKSYIGQTGLSLNERKAEHIRKAKKNSPTLFWSAIELKVINGALVEKWDKKQEIK